MKPATKPNCSVPLAGLMRSGPLAGLAFAALSMVSARAARADLVYELGPALSGGWTDNATNASTSMPASADEFVSASGTARVRYRGQKTDQSLGYRISATRYFHFSFLDTLSQELAWVSTYNLTAKLDLALGATATLSHTTAYTLTDASAALPQAQSNGDQQYFSTAANETLTYSPTPQQKYVEAFQASHLTRLNTPVPLPETTYVGGSLRGSWEPSRNTFSLELALGDTYTFVPAGGSQTLAGHRLFGQLLAGWRREFSTTWSTDLEAGGLIVTDTVGNGFTAPAGTAELTYRRLTWFATLQLSQTAAPNIFIGNTTLNDQVSLRLTLPLDRAELFFVSGFASEMYARVADDDAHEKAFDMLSVGASLTARSARLPFWGSLDYGFSDQHGSTLPGLGLIPDRKRQTVLLTIGGSFSFGKGTPPIFRGVL